MSTRPSQTIALGAEQGVAGERPRRFIDSLTVPLTVVLALFIVKVANPISYDPDLYWHLKAGEYILATGTLPYADIFSYTAYGKDWVLHEWLSEVLFYAIARTAGLTALWGFVAALYAATFLVLYGLCARLLRHPTRALVVALLFFAPVVGFASPRPQIFTYLLFAVYLRILLDWKYAGETRRLALLPLLMLLWVNLHGAAIVGMALLVLVMLAEGATLCLDRAPQPQRIAALKKLAAWAALTALATLANPRFIDYWLYPFQVINLSVATRVINEWKSPDFHALDFRYVLALFLSFFAAIAYSRRKPDATEFALPVFFIAAGFTSIRHLPLACIAAAPFFSVALKQIELPAFGRLPGSAWWRKARIDREVDDRHLPYLNALLLCGVIAAMAYTHRHRSNEDVVESVMPVKAADFIVQHGIAGNMFNEYGEGGYLIYRLYPRDKVFIDGRADLYGDAFMTEYLAIVGGTADWKRKFDRYAVDFAVLPKDVPLRQLLLADKAFKLVYDDARHSVLVRDEPQFAALPAVSPQISGDAASECAAAERAPC